ncbi:MAG: DUF1800 family protein [Granulosicoccus sp.]
MQIFAVTCVRTRLVASFILLATAFSCNVFAAPTHTLTNGDWSLISIPADPGGNGTVVSIFGDNLPAASYGQNGNWVMYAFNAESNDYRELALNDTLEANTGYWIVQTVKDYALLTVPDSLAALDDENAPGCPPDTECAAKTLVGGVWNLVGASLATPRRFRDTRFQQDNTPCAAGCTPWQANNNDLLPDAVYRYTPDGYEKIRPTTELRPWDGLWLPVYDITPSLLWSLPIDASHISLGAAEKDAARLLMQASFGPTDDAIDNVLALGGPAQWIDAQLSLPAQLHLPEVVALYPNELGAQESRYETFWKRTLNADDQLRQRVAFALSQFLVISDRSAATTSHADLVAAYYDVLISNAFGNYRDLLQQITLNPAMGLYLSMLGNDKPDNATGLRADENYAREVMQLFTIGLVGLNLDGSEKTGVVSYTQPDVENMARALTGWFWRNKTWRTNTFQAWWPDRDRMSQPMMAYADHHDMDEKTILGTTLPAGQSAEQDLNMALDILFNHPNVAPFVSSQLIKRLVTSNPSRGYVRRVSTIFNNNGAGVRGDLSAVIKAILLDDEARNPTISNRDGYGKLREPLLRYAHVLRAFNVTDRINFRKWLTFEIPQIAPLTAPSVFNFYSPRYVPPGEIAQAGLVAPEFQINSGSRLNTVNRTLMKIVINDRIKEIPVRLNLEEERLLLDRPADLLYHLDRVLTAGRLTPTSKQKLTRYINANKGLIADEQLLRDVIGLVATSTEFAIQR